MRLKSNVVATQLSSFLYTETDGNDLTYFILDEIWVIEKAMDRHFAYILTKPREPICWIWPD